MHYTWCCQWFQTVGLIRSLHLPPRARGAGCRCTDSPRYYSIAGISLTSTLVQTRPTALTGVSGHLRDLSSSLAAWAALSSPVGSKLLHLSLGLSPPPPPPPLEPPAGGVGGGGGGWTGKPGGTSGCPLLRPKSQDILRRMNETVMNGRRTRCRFRRWCYRRCTYVSALPPHVCLAAVI